jgi:hypothetical protein
MPGPPLNRKENQELNDQSPKWLKRRHPGHVLLQKPPLNKLLDGALLTGVMPLVAPELLVHIELYSFSIL